MRAALLIAAKDMRQRLRDRSAILLGLVAPLGLAIIFGLIVPDFDGGELRIGAAVIDEDGGPLAGVFRNEVLGVLETEGLFEMTSFPTGADALEAVEEGEISAVFVIPAGFSEDVLAGRAATLGVVGNVDAQIASLVAEGVAGDFAGTLSGIQVAAEVSGTPVATVAAGLGEAPRSVVLEFSDAPSKILGATTFFAGGMAIFFLFFTVQFGVSSLLEERIEGTLPRLLAAPINRASILGGKGMASMSIGAIAMAVLAIATTLFVGADWGDPLAVVVLILVSVLAALGVMALVATLARTPEQASNWQAIIAVVLGMLGGTFFPVSQGPEALADLSLVTPHAWFMRALGELQLGGGVGSIVGPLMAILAFAAVTLGIAALRITRMVRV